MISSKATLIGPETRDYREMKIVTFRLDKTPLILYFQAGFYVD